MASTSGDGLFGQDDVSTTHFSIGDEVITRIDDNTKTMTVETQRRGAQDHAGVDGQGQHADQQRHLYRRRSSVAHVMDSSTYGVPVNSPNGYRTEVDWATQISYSGIYVSGSVKL